ncbi:MAG: glycosyltransferase family 4 protein [Chloroflexia bacterium]|nr:glycosyltransferase family 4 protein [Chloroflexia bacterium]
MNILFVLTYYAPHRTGLTLHVKRVAEALVQRGHQATVLTSRYHPDLPKDETMQGVRVVRLWPLMRLSRTQVMPAFPLAAWRLVGQHDVINVHTPLPESFLFPLFARWRGQRPLVVTHHGDAILPAGWPNRLIEWAIFNSYRLAARYATAVIGYSHDYAEHSPYLRTFRSKVTVVYPPIEIPQPDPAGVEAMRQKYHLEGKTVVGYAGRFVEEKRPDLLIQAIPHLLERFPRLCLAFAGEYLIRYEHFYERCLPLIQKYHEHLLFLGLLPKAQQMADFYALCDVLALPSGTECFGMVQPEAMLCGTPVVVSDTPGGREAVRVTGMGQIFPSGDVPALAESLARVLGNPQTYVKPHHEIAAMFSLEKTVDHYERLFQQGLEQGARRDRS